MNKLNFKDILLNNIKNIKSNIVREYILVDFEFNEFDIFPLDIDVKKYKNFTLDINESKLFIIEKFINLGYKEWFVFGTPSHFFVCSINEDKKSYILSKRYSTDFLIYPISKQGSDGDIYYNVLLELFFIHHGFIINYTNNVFLDKTDIEIFKKSITSQELDVITLEEEIKDDCIIHTAFFKEEERAIIRTFNKEGDLLSVIDNLYKRDMLVANSIRYNKDYKDMVNLTLLNVNSTQYPF